MISRNCIFLSLNFILLVMMIESNNKVSPSYYVNKILSISYVNTVNNLITYNEREIKFSDKELTALTIPVQTYNDTKYRDKVLDKFVKKIEDIKCTCSLIVKMKLVNLTNILEELRRGKPIEVARRELNVLKEEAGFMVLLFQKGNVKAGKWFWSYYFKTMSIIEYERNKNFFGELTSGEDEVQSSLTNFINYCKDNKYLPKYRTEFDLMSKNPNVPINMFQTLRASDIIVVDYVNDMQYISIDHFYLEPLWNEDELFFSQITGSAIEWRPTIRRHAVEVNKTKEYIKNRQWISNPFGHLSYHKLIIQIISLRMYTFLWVLLVIFNKKMDSIERFHLELLCVESMRTIDVGHELMPYTETFYFDVVAEIRCAVNDNKKNFDSIIDRISVRVKDILDELYGCNSNESDWMSVDINKEFSYAMIFEFLREFRDNFNLLKDKITIFNYGLALSILVEGN